ncbi:hypothetical protein GGI02_004913 [Coemansia sp. RSA 2322]|nr:hypothetical protein GGI02_004913 [Coemansia sp. RSA 2322]
MARNFQTEYNELAEVVHTAAGTGAAERTYEAGGGSEFAATAYQHHKSLGSLVRDMDVRRHVLVVVSYVLLWYTFSGLLSVYNKWLFGASERDFPFPLLVGAIHMLVQHLLATACLWIVPSLRLTTSPTWGMYLTRVGPCGVASALDIGLSNISLQTITLTFYTMCKSSSLGFVLLFAFLFGLERPRVTLIGIIAVISVGVVLMAAGEVDFVLAGFLEAVGSSAMSGLRWSLTQVLLVQTRFGMSNPIATVSRLTPIMGVCMLVFSLILEDPFTTMWNNKNLQTVHDTLFMAFMMAFGGLLAFAMVLSEYFLIGQTSVLTLSIAGMLKEVMMVGVAHFVFGDTMTAVNFCGLLVALLGIGMYNWLKIHDRLQGNGGKPMGEGAAAEAGMVGEYSLEQLDSEARQRQVLFAGEPYGEAIDLDLAAINERADGPQQSPSPGSSDDHGSRRRHSVFTIENGSGRPGSNTSSDEGGPNNLTSSSDMSPNAAATIHQQQGKPRRFVS